MIGCIQYWHVVYIQVIFGKIIYLYSYNILADVSVYILWITLVIIY